MAILSRGARTIRADHRQFLVEDDRKGDCDVAEVSSRLMTGRATAIQGGFVVATARLWGDTRV
ncbi:MAG TPA: hypothetical protein VGV87_31535 [Blastocatellia bacterium]|nr:hypothetical protein [Blastocatellia bacterium]